MRTNCKKFVSQCVQCARNKLSLHRPHCLLQPLPVPECPWHSISMDFIERLVPSNGFTAILVVWTAFLRIFIPTADTATVSDAADAFVTHVRAQHGILRHVPSDRSHPTSSVHFTSGHYPSANGLVEHINSALEHHLRIYCSYEQDNWSKLLPSAEFA
jgi:hypothetical protein